MENFIFDLEYKSTRARKPSAFIQCSNEVYGIRNQGPK